MGLFERISHRVRRRLFAVLSMAVALASTACQKWPTIHTLDHAPNPRLTSSRPLPANVAILPIEDHRTTLDRRAEIAKVPLFFYGRFELQNPAHIDWSDFPDVPVIGWFARRRYDKETWAKWKKWRKDHLEVVLYNHAGETEMLPLLNRYLRESNTFSNTLMLQKREPVPPDVDYIVKLTFDRWALTGWATYYGLSLMGPGVLQMIGLPESRYHWELDYTISIEEVATGATLLGRRYRANVAGPIEAYGFMPWALLYSEQRGWFTWVNIPILVSPPIKGIGVVEAASFEAQDLLPTVKDSLEDFTKELHKVLLPLAGNVQYWNSLAAQREERVKKAAETAPPQPLSHYLPDQTSPSTKLPNAFPQLSPKSSQPPAQPPPAP